MEKMITISIKCRLCGKTFNLSVAKSDWEKYNNGVLAQNAFPYLTADERELLTSHTCTDCFDRLFGVYQAI